MPRASPLPPLYSQWVTELIGASIPSETAATCDSCPMCTTDPEVRSFRPDTKCCTYLPNLPNYLVGRVLGDTSEEGQASMRARMARGVGVTPLGVARSESEDLVYLHAADESFGNATSLRCPHYIEEGGRCGIWRNRNGVCATWFCKHVRGAVGQTFWQRVRQLLSRLERDLSVFCVLELDVGAAALARLTPFEPAPGIRVPRLSVADLDGGVTAAERAKVWGSWTTREEDFYRASAKIVGELDLSDILRIASPETRWLTSVVRDAWKAQRRRRLPLALELGRLQVVGRTTTSCRVTTYSELDPLEVARNLFDTLPYFDGRPVRDVLSALEEAGRPPLSEGLVRKLVDFEILVPMPDPQATFVSSQKEASDEQHQEESR